MGIDIFSDALERFARQIAPPAPDRGGPQLDRSCVAAQGPRCNATARRVRFGRLWDRRARSVETPGKLLTCAGITLF
jgi:hypothetical protein